MPRGCVRSINIRDYNVKIFDLHLRTLFVYHVILYYVNHP